MAKLTRRRFMGGTLSASAAAVAFPNIARTQNANSKMGVAVAGVNGRGGSHVGAFVGDDRTEVAYIVDIDEEVGNKRVEQVAQRQGTKPKFVTDIREALGDGGVDIVSTATPNHWHALIGVWAMQAGKDVYVEKPVSHNVWEGSALVAAARKYGRICQVGTQCRSNPAIHDAIAFMDEGGIGEVNFARGLCYKRRQSIGALGNYDIPSTCDFHLWSGPATYTDPKLTRPGFHYDWHWQRHYGNGDSGNQGPHQTDIARWGLGLKRHPESILTYGGRLGYQAERNDPNYVDAGDTPNTEVTIFDYGDKCIVFETRGLSVDDSADTELNTIFQSTRGNKIGVVWYGSEGYMVQRSYTNCVAYDKDMKEIKQFNGGGDHFGNFIDACISRKAEDLNADVLEGHYSAAMAHLGNISLYLGEDDTVSVAEAKKAVEGVKSLDDNVATLERTRQHLVDNGVDLDKYPMSMGPMLKFDPVKEIFPDNKAATKMLTRDYREGFECPLPEQV